MLDITASRDEQVGAFRVRRALPTRRRRTIGAWCFADHMGPASVDADSGLDVGPHPHMGLSTVTWLIDGQALHKDSLGSEQLIAPGQLNLMTAGHGVAHAEEATGHYRGTLQGIQLWVAQPEQTRHGESAFEHFRSLPQTDLDGGTGTVLIGDFAGAVSPARADTALVGVELDLHRTTTLPLDPTFEYGLIALTGSVSIDSTPLEPGNLGYVAPGLDEIRIDIREPAKVMLIGGEPFESAIFMWWNFVGRSRAEIDAAYDAWTAGEERFGRVHSALPRIPVAAPFWRQQ